MATNITQAVKTALLVTSADFDGEINDLIEAGKADLGIVGKQIDETDPLIKQAVITYCRLHFGSPTDYDRLKASYDEQKAQIRSCSKYERETV